MFHSGRGRLLSICVQRPACSKWSVYALLLICVNEERSHLGSVLPPWEYLFSETIPMVVNTTVRLE